MLHGGPRADQRCFVGVADGVVDRCGVLETQEHVHSALDRVRGLFPFPSTFMTSSLTRASSRTISEAVVRRELPRREVVHVGVEDAHGILAEVVRDDHGVVSAGARAEQGERELLNIVVLV